MFCKKKESITEALLDTLIKAGPKGNQLYIFFQKQVGTPEENVTNFFEINRKLIYKKLFEDYF